MTEKNIFLHFVLCTRTFINVNFQIVIFVFDNRVDFLQLTKCACHFWCIIPKLTSQSACPWTTALTNHGKRRITSKLFKRDVKSFSWKIYMFKFDLHLHFWFESSQVCNMLGFKIVIWAIFFSHAEVAIKHNSASGQTQSTMAWGMLTRVPRRRLQSAKRARIYQYR